MCKYLKQYIVDSLTFRKRNIIQTLEWAVLNSDLELAKMCDVELRMIINRLEQFKQGVEE